MIWKKAFRDLIWKVAGAIVILEINLILSTLFYPDFKEMFDKLAESFFGQLPVVQNILKLTGLNDFPGYILVQHFFKGVNVLGSVTVVLMGMGVVAREVENRTIDVLLSRPISRAKILFIYAITGAFLIYVAVFVSSLSAIPISSLIENPGELPLALLLQCSFHASLFLTFLYCGVLWLSCISSEQSRVIFIGAGALLLMFLIYFIQEFHTYSLFRLNDLPLFIKISQTGELPWVKELALLGGILLFLGGAVYSFQKRDF